MADFVQSSETKSAIRELASQIEDVTTFNSIVQLVITDNPFACVSYMTAGVTHDRVEKTKESYTVKLVYQDSEAKTVGTLSDKYSTIAGFNAGATALLASAPVTAAHGGTAVRDIDNEAFSSPPLPAPPKPPFSKHLTASPILARHGLRSLKIPKPSPKRAPFTLRSPPVRLKNFWIFCMNRGSGEMREIHFGVRRESHSIRAPNRPSFTLTVLPIQPP